MTGQKLRSLGKGGGCVKDRWKDLLLVIKRTRYVFVDNAMNVYSTFAAFYILLSLLPMNVLLVAAVSMVSEEYLSSFNEILAAIFPSVPQVQSLVSGFLDNVRGNAGAMLVSVSALTLLWSASTGVSAIQLGLNRICGAIQSVIKRRAACLLYTLVFVLLIPVLIVFRVMRSSIEELVVRLDDVLHMPDVAARIVKIFENSNLITFLAMFGIILLAYTFLPSRGRYWKAQIPGAVFTVVLWAVFSKIFDFFIIRFWKASFLYGSLAAIFLLAMWMNSIMMILFLGASLNQALHEQGYWEGLFGSAVVSDKNRSSRNVLCVYLIFAMIVLACILTKL